MSTLELKAKRFATNAHGSIGQTRKYTGEPYINHPAGVVEILRLVSHTEEMISAAWLHDVVEDTPVELEEIRREFGDGVAAMVEMVTDVSRLQDGNRAIRKLIDLEHLSLANPDAKTIKLADLIHNSESINKHDQNFARIYMAEKRELLKVLKEGDSVLWARANQVVNDFYFGKP